MFSCEFCEIFKSTFFTENFRVTASVEWTIVTAYGILFWSKNWSGQWAVFSQVIVKKIQLFSWGESQISRYSWIEATVPLTVCQVISMAPFIVKNVSSNFLEFPSQCFYWRYHLSINLHNGYATYIRKYTSKASWEFDMYVQFRLCVRWVWNQSENVSIFWCSQKQPLICVLKEHWKKSQNV